VSLRPSRSCTHLHQHALPARVSVCPTPGLSTSPCLRHWVAQRRPSFRMGAISVSATSVDARVRSVAVRVLPATSVGSSGCRRRVLSLSRDRGDSTRNGDGIELSSLMCLQKPQCKYYMAQWPYHPFLRHGGGSKMIRAGKMSTDDHRNREELYS
jgi:predicted metal-binding protein